MAFVRPESLSIVRVPDRGLIVFGHGEEEIAVSVEADFCQCTGVSLEQNRFHCRLV